MLTPPVYESPVVAMCASVKLCCTVPIGNSTRNPYTPAPIWRPVSNSKVINLLASFLNIGSTPIAVAIVEPGLVAEFEPMLTNVIDTVACSKKGYA